MADTPAVIIVNGRRIAVHYHHPEHCPDCTVTAPVGSVVYDPHGDTRRLTPPAPEEDERPEYAVPCYSDPTVCNFPNPCGDACADRPDATGPAPDQR